MPIFTPHVKEICYQECFEEEEKRIRHYQSPPKKVVEVFVEVPLQKPWMSHRAK